MIIECHICEAMVDAKPIGEHKCCDADDPAEFYSHLRVPTMPHNASRRAI